MLEQARTEAGFRIQYPCQLPAGERLASVALTGQPGKRTVALAFEGPFEISLHQSQVAPAYGPDPTGASRVNVDLFPGVRGILLERYDGSRKAQYDIFWDRDGLHYELLVVGPPLSRRQVLLFVTSLE